MTEAKPIVDPMGICPANLWPTIYGPQSMATIYGPQSDVFDLNRSYANSSNVVDDLQWLQEWQPPTPITRFVDRSIDRWMATIDGASIECVSRWPLKTTMTTMTPPMICWVVAIRTQATVTYFWRSFCCCICPFLCQLPFGRVAIRFYPTILRLTFYDGWIICAF